MTIQSGVIQGTAKQIKAALAKMPDDEVVRLMVGRPSLSVIARKLQSEATARGMTDAKHDELMVSLKNEL
jgi:acyl CoA:acetate/3-ketoacid CoA transferase beta subunit